jgi:hypothetical protein
MRRRRDMELARFMASTAGRVIRVGAGIALLIWALLGGGVLIGLVGLLLVAVGVFNVCLIAPLFRGPLRGNSLR